ncbi:MAG: GNAT family N-acetyltransferase, partial [Firmicutes bacterium]|nr:GNAT family N-acetyltransferase [Bacillota bacterium]
MGHYHVLSLQDREQWLQELENLKELCPDLHYRPEYCGLFRGQGEARLFVYREGTASVVYPFLLRKVNLISGLEGALGQDLYDITSPYGYGGPLASPAAAESVWDNFYRCFVQYCKKNDIITEFIRFHPLLGNHRLLTNHVEVERVSSVVCVDLKGSDEEIWSGYERNNRKNIKKAYREGLEVILEETPAHFTDFITIYHQTMLRNRAGEFYFFSGDFYDRIHKELKGHFLYAHTLRGGRVISTELLLYNETYIHSFLGGTLDEFFEYRPNNILKHEVIKWAKKKGIKYFLLGGG